MVDRLTLTTLVSAIITMSSLVISITIVALSMAATQFGSRVVRASITDLRSKLALGVMANRRRQREQAVQAK